jgi:hypothetical protein
MIKMVRLKNNVWHSEEELSDVMHIRELVEQYKIKYPEAIVDYDEADYGEWITYDEQYENTSDGYWSDYYCYRLTIKFKDDAAEAEFMLKESI